MRTLLATAVVAGLTLVCGPAEAFNCAIPGLVNPAKKAVCSNPLLSAANSTEVALLDSLRGKLTSDARRALIRDRRSYLTTRDGCRGDERCLEATMRAQVRLYRRVEGCVPAAPSAQLAASRTLFCTTRAIERHRQELHRSL